MRAKRVLTILTARSALKATERHERNISISYKKITVSIGALDAYIQYLPNCQISLSSTMLGRKTRAIWAVRFLITH